MSIGSPYLLEILYLRLRKDNLTQEDAANIFQRIICGMPSQSLNVFKGFAADYLLLHHMKRLHRKV